MELYFDVIFTSCQDLMHIWRTYWKCIIDITWEYLHTPFVLYLSAAEHLILNPFVMVNDETATAVEWSENQTIVHVLLLEDKTSRPPQHCMHASILLSLVARCSDSSVQKALQHCTSASCLVLVARFSVSSVQISSETNLSDVYYRKISLKLQ